MFGDITARNNETAPSCNVYISGAPCPPFSNAGLRKSLGDSRSCVLLSSVDYVLTRKPKLAIFENVSGLVNAKNKPIFNAIVKVLKTAGYKCQAQIMNNCTHGAIPHNRPRLYLVAMLEDGENPNKELPWFPDAVDCHKLQRFLVNNVKQNTRLCKSAAKNVTEARRIAKKKWGKDHGLVVVDAQASAKFRAIMHGKVPCLTKARGGSNGHYIIFKYQGDGRWMNLQEIGGLQGWPKLHLDYLQQSHSACVIGKTLGDGFCLTLWQRLFAKVLLAANLIKKKDQPPDIWVDCHKAHGHLPDAMYGADTKHEKFALWH